MECKKRSTPEKRCTCCNAWSKEESENLITCKKCNYTYYKTSSICPECKTENP